MAYPNDPYRSGQPQLHAPAAHAYPPGAHSGGVGGASDPYGQQRPPSQSYAFDYQRRRDERHGPTSYMGPPPASAAPSSMSGSSSGIVTPAPPYEMASSHGLHEGGGAAPESSRRGSKPLGRERSASDSSLQPLKLEPVVSGKKGEYPAGWTKEDEEAEQEFLRQGLINWKKIGSWRFWLRKEWWLYYLITIVICVVVALMTIYHDQIVTWLTPVAEWMRDLPAGWTIPIVILFVLSFPPLFGHEIVTILIGAIWGLWIGFAITSAGTFLGEIANFYAFRYCLRSRAEKLERKNFNYAVMAHVVREGGFFIVFMARLSAIPGHFTTAVFSTCGTGIITFTIATILTLPKQLIVVYLGVIFAQSANGEQSKNDKIISHVSLAVGFLITVWAAWYIWHKMNKAKLVVWRRHRMAMAVRGVSVDPTTGLDRQGFRDGDVERLEDADAEAEADAANPHTRGARHLYGLRHGTRPTREGHYVPTGHGSEQDLGYDCRPGTQAFPEPRPSGEYRSDFASGDSRPLFAASHPPPGDDRHHRPDFSAPPPQTQAESRWDQSADPEVADRYYRPNPYPHGQQDHTGQAYLPPHTRP